MNPYAISPFALDAQRPADDPDKNPPPKEQPRETDRGQTEPSEPKAGAPKDVAIPEMMNEISWSETDVIQSYMPFASNPDPVVRSKSLKIYREMLHDEQVKVSLDVRKEARLASTWEVKAGKEGDSKSEEMAEFIKHVLKRLPGTFEEALGEIYSAFEYGFSVSEKVYDYIETGKFKGKIGLKAIKTREPFNYDFKIDPHGNLLGLVYTGMGIAAGATTREDRLVIGGPMSANQNPYLTGLLQRETSRQVFGTVDNPFPPEKFIIYNYHSRFGNWYGWSDLNAAFPWWMRKKHGAKFWSIWLERYASPFVWAQYKRDAGLKKEQLTAIDDFIRNLSARQGVRVSDAVTLNTVTFPSDANSGYETAIEAYNRFISHAILCPNLLGFSQQQKTGSYALGQKHFDAFVWVLEKAGRDTSEKIVGDQIIKPLVQINFGAEIDPELYPKFQFLSVEEDSIDVRSRIVTTLGNAGFVDPNEDWVRDFLTLPKKDPSIVLVRPGPFGADPNDPEGKKPPFGKQPGNEKETKRPSDKETPKEEEPEKKEMNRKFAERQADEFEQKVRFRVFKGELEAADDALMQAATIDIEDIRDKLIEQVTKRGIVRDGDSAAVGKLAINLGALKATLEQWIVKVTLDSKLRALEELSRAGLDVEIVRKFAASDAPMEDWQPVPPAEAIDFFRRKVTARVVDRNGKRIVIDLGSGVDLTYIRQKAFAVAGIVRDDILNDAKQVILNGIKRQDEAGAVKDLKDLFNRYLDQGIAVEGELLEPHRLRTIVRTNISEAVNRGRAGLMEDPDVGDFVQFWQYSAILDERTTEYCRCMDGNIYRKEDLGILEPPAHYNCRSVVVPITQFEVERARVAGRGIEVSEPCAGRMAGFSERRETKNA